MSPRCRLFLSDVQRVEVIGRCYLHAFANSAGESVEQIVQDDANALKTASEKCVCSKHEKWNSSR